MERFDNKSVFKYTIFRGFLEKIKGWNDETSDKKIKGIYDFNKNKCKQTYEFSNKTFMAVPYEHDAVGNYFCDFLWNIQGNV